jgi:hypothetical protein
VRVERLQVPGRDATSKSCAVASIAHSVNPRLLRRGVTIFPRSHHAMKPVEVSTVIRRPIAQVYAHLDVLGNHEAFTDHFLVDWELHGAASGVGASVRMRVRAPGRSEEVELTVIDAEPPVRTVEETVGAGGRRRTRGTYTLAALDADRTEVRFEIDPLEVPRSERPLWPLSRAWLRRQNARSLERLRGQLEGHSARAAA